MRAKERGYFIRCYYILTADPLINVYRVKSRVAAGGHDVPKDKIISRYDKALDLVKELLKICDICHIYDNSAEVPIGSSRSERINFTLTNVRIGI